MVNQLKMRPWFQDLVKLEVGKCLAHKNKMSEVVSLLALQVSLVVLAKEQAQLSEAQVDWVALQMIPTQTLTLI